MLNFSVFNVFFSPQPHSIIPPVLSQISLISPGPDFTKICHRLLFSALPSPPFRSPRSDFLCFPTSDYFPSSAHFPPSPSPVFRSFLHLAFNNICQSLTSSLLFSLKCVWSLSTFPFHCFPASTSQFSAPLTVILHVLLLFSLFITVTCFIRPKLIKQWPPLPPAPPG